MTRACAIAVGMLCLLASPAAAQSMPVPPPLQGALFSKIFAYDATLHDRGSDLTVLVTYVSSSSDDAHAVAKAFRAMGIKARLTSMSEIAARVGSADAVYVSPGVPASQVAGLCAAHNVLSITGLPGLVRQGLVAVGVGRKANNRPSIVVNMTRLKTENHRLSAQLLQLATVVK